MDTEQPEIVTLNETALKGKRSIRQSKYFASTKNREKHMGRVAPLVSNKLKEYTTNVGEGTKGDEYDIVRVDHFTHPVNIINY